MKIYHIRILNFIPIFICLCCVIIPTHAQSFWNDLIISVEFAAAHHDTRGSDGAKRMTDVPGRWSPWQFGVSIRKTVSHWGNVHLNAGLGYSLEYQNYYRDVYHCFHLPEGSPCTAIAIQSDYYKIHLAQVPVNVTFPITSHLIGELSLLPLFDVYKIVRKPSGELIGEEMTIDFYSLEINPGIKYQGKRIGFGMNYRLYQIKKIDPVIFGPRGGLEDYNPLKFWFSVGYRLGNAASLR